MHRTSPLMSIKALRWWARQCTWQEFSVAMHSPLANAYAKDTQCKDIKEAVPIPRAVVVAWEKAVGDATTPRSVKLFLGTALLCTHASVRFGDFQRTEWLSLQLSASALHGSCRATKTTRKGQPFACAWHGLTDRNAATSWVLQWLSELAKFMAPHPPCALPE